MKKQFISKKSFNFVSGIFAAAFLLAGCSMNNMKYGGYNGYDDDTIDYGFDGFPEATWNVD